MPGSAVQSRLEVWTPRLRRALAVRQGVPIFATDSVLDRAGVVPEGADEEKLSVFRDFVNSLNVDLPDDPGESRRLD